MRLLPMMAASRAISLVEAITNVMVGYVIAVATQFFVFPLFGLHASINANLIIGAVFTVVSLAVLRSAPPVREVAGSARRRQGAWRRRIR